MKTETKPFAIVNDVETSHKATAICEVWDYGVWGNDKEGYEVNDRFCRERELEILCPMTISNVPRYPAAKDDYREFPDSSSFSAAVCVSFEIPEKDIIKLFGKGIEISGEGECYQIYDAKGKPLGEIVVVGWRA